MGVCESIREILDDRIKKCACGHGLLTYLICSKGDLATSWIKFLLIEHHKVRQRQQESLVMASNVVKAGAVGKWDSEVANRCPWIVVCGRGGGSGRDE